MCVLFFKQKTAYEMRISDWSSDVCSSDLITLRPSAMSTLGGGLGFERQVEDRGDPESRTLTDIGPRRLNDFSGNAFYRLTEARLGVQASGEVHKLNYLRSLDDERDYTSYRGALRGFYRMRSEARGG